MSDGARRPTTANGRHPPHYHGEYAWRGHVRDPESWGHGIGGDGIGTMFRDDVDAFESDAKEGMWKPKPVVFRPDARIGQDACEVLADAEIDATDMEIEVEHGEITLSGCVCDRRSKQLAGLLVASVRGVRQCNNRLLVGTSEPCSGEDWESHTELTSGATRGPGPSSEYDSKDGADPHA